MIFPKNKVALLASELHILKRLSSPQKIQDFLNALPANFEKNGDTALSPRRVLREGHAHCIEGAILAALALYHHGQKPLLLDLTSSLRDQDHVVALFRHGKYWGAISKTNHAVLRYREPVYRTVRELAMSYFHEYFLNDGTKTLRSYSDPVDLSRLKDTDWMISEKNLWYIVDLLNDAPHHDILTRSMIARLRKADPIEREVGKITQWKRIDKMEK